MVGHMTKHMTHRRSWDTEIMTCRHVSHVPLTTVRRLLNVGNPFGDVTAMVSLAYYTQRRTGARQRACIVHH